jgi:hypothetical protein
MSVARRNRVDFYQAVIFRDGFLDFTGHSQQDVLPHR